MCAQVPHNKLIHIPYLSTKIMALSGTKAWLEIGKCHLNMQDIQDFHEIWSIMKYEGEVQHRDNMMGVFNNVVETDDDMVQEIIVRIQSLEMVHEVTRACALYFNKYGIPGNKSFNRDILLFQIPKLTHYIIKAYNDEKMKTRIIK